MSITVSGEPAISINENVISENLPIYNSLGETISSSSTTDANIQLDDIHGWNENQSVFYGLTTTSTNVYYNDPLGKLTFKKYIDDMSAFTYSHTSPQIFPSLLGLYEGSRRVFVESFSDNTNDSIIFNANSSVAANYKGKLNFGMRLKAENVCDTISITVNDAATFINLGGSANITFNDEAQVQSYLSGTNISLNYWQNLIDSGVLLHYNGSDYVVRRRTDNFLDLDRIPAPAASMGNLLAGETFTLTTAVQQDLYGFYDNPVANPPNGNSTGSPAVYETVIHRTNASFTQIKWRDRGTILNGNSCLSVDIMELDGNILNSYLGSAVTNGEYVEVDLTTAIFNDIDDGRFRVRFSFNRNLNGNNANGRRFPTPQLFGVVVDYFINDDRSPDKYIYSRQ